MKKRLAVLVGLVATVFAMIGVSLTMVSEDAGFTPVDLTRIVLLPDGSERSLEEVIALTTEALESAPRPLPEEDAAGADAPAEDEFVLTDDLPLGHIYIIPEIPSRRMRRTDIGWTLEANPDDVLGLASIKMDELKRGTASAEEVLALLRSVPESHPGYLDAQRHIGWSILTKHQDEPSKGIPFVTRALVAAPFDGDSWEDASRVYASALGFSLHDL